MHACSGHPNVGKNFTPPCDKSPLHAVKIHWFLVNTIHPHIKNMDARMKSSDAFFSHAKIIWLHNKTSPPSLALRSAIQANHGPQEPKFLLKDLSVCGKKLPLMSAHEWLQLESNHTSLQLKK
jgi:hypothetical protein